MNFNSNKGKGLLNEVPTVATLLTTSQDKIEANAAKMAQLAENSVDRKSIPDKITKTSLTPYYVRSYRMSLPNLQKLDALKAAVGSDFNFQVNKALEYWFEKEHPEIVV
jgi:hypothetical protein